MTDDSHVIALRYQAACEESNYWQRMNFPHVIYKPRLFPDGDKWCALLGENIQEGVVGFGESPELAALAFDKAWYEKIALSATPSSEGKGK